MCRSALFESWEAHICRERAISFWMKKYFRYDTERYTTRLWWIWSQKNTTRLIEEMFSNFAEVSRTNEGALDKKLNTSMKRISSAFTCYILFLTYCSKNSATKYSKMLFTYTLSQR